MCVRACTHVSVCVCVYVCVSMYVYVLVCVCVQRDRETERQKDCDKSVFNEKESSCESKCWSSHPANTVAEPENKAIDAANAHVFVKEEAFVLAHKVCVCVFVCVCVCVCVCVFVCV